MTPEQRARRRKLILKTYARTGGIRKTSKALHISIHVVRRVLRGLDTDAPTLQRSTPRPSKLDAFKPILTRLIQEDGLTAVLAHEELRTLGFEGSYSIVKRFARTVRPKPKRRPTTVLEHPPGAEAQVDWSPYTVWLGDARVCVHCFSMVLPFSRWMFVRFRLDETLDTLVACHDEAFAALGGVPVLMTYDNMTTVGRHVGPDEIALSPRFEAYKDACGFEISLITPGRPNEHASVERPFHYVENNCLRRRRSRFRDFDDLQAHAQWWCDQIANVRVHGTTRERPIDRLMRERAYLLPLPWHRAESYRDVARLGECQLICVRGSDFFHVVGSRPSKWIANCRIARLHVGLALPHFFFTSRVARYSNLMAASGDGRWPRVFTTLRSWRWRASTAFVV
jgi:transposase